MLVEKKNAYTPLMSSLTHKHSQHTHTDLLMCRFTHKCICYLFELLISFVQLYLYLCFAVAVFTAQFYDVFRSLLKPCLVLFTHSQYEMWLLSKPVLMCTFLLLLCMYYLHLGFCYLKNNGSTFSLKFCEKSFLTFFFATYSKGFLYPLHLPFSSC